MFPLLCLDKNLNDFISLLWSLKVNSSDFNQHFLHLQLMHLIPHLHRLKQMFRLTANTFPAYLCGLTVSQLLLGPA